jgi:hypothetical protein
LPDGEMQYVAMVMLLWGQLDGNGYENDDESPVTMMMTLLHDVRGMVQHDEYSTTTNIPWGLMTITSARATDRSLMDI